VTRPQAVQSVNHYVPSGCKRFFCDPQQPDWLLGSCSCPFSSSQSCVEMYSVTVLILIRLHCGYITDLILIIRIGSLLQGSEKLIFLLALLVYVFWGR